MVRDDQVTPSGPLVAMLPLETPSGRPVATRPLETRLDHRAVMRPLETGLPGPLAHTGPLQAATGRPSALLSSSGAGRDSCSVHVQLVQCRA